MRRFFLFLFFTISIFFSCCDTYAQRKILNDQDAIVGASRLELYLPEIKDKNVGIVANQTSIFNNTPLIDTLLTYNIDIRKIFTPEHGFRGKADEGASVGNSIDEKTNIPIK